LDKYINDFIGIAGLSAFGYGVWTIDPAYSMISVGIILMLLAYKMSN